MKPKTERKSNSPRGGFAILLGALFLVITGACRSNVKTETGYNPLNIPHIKLHSAWNVDRAYPGYLPMSLYGKFLLIPYTRGKGLILVDASTGSVIWRKENVFTPESNAVLHGNDIYVMGYFPEGCCIGWYTLDGVYKGYITCEGAAENEAVLETINLIGDSIYWNDNGYSSEDPAGDLWRFDTKASLKVIEKNKYSATKDVMRIIYHKSGQGYINVMGGQVLGYGDDVVFTYENDMNAASSMHKPCKVIRLNPSTGAVVWEYQTQKARHFWQYDLLSYGSQILVNGCAGAELIDSADPGASMPAWAYDDELHQNLCTALIVGDTLFEDGDNSPTAVSAYSMKDGKQLWCLPNTTSAGQIPQYHDGVLYVSEQEGVLAVDAAKGRWIGRDDDFPGYIDQVCNTLAYGDLFIFFSNQTNPDGRVEALYMDEVPD